MQSLGEILRGIASRRRPGEVVERDPEPEPCAVCHGRGWLRTGFKTIGRDRIDQTVPCGCVRVAMPGPTFETFHINPKHPDLSIAYDAAVTWSEGQGPPLLMLLGERGVGKTHLARAAYNAVIQRGERALWMKDGKVVDTLHTAFEQHTVEVWMEEWGTVRWLFIDELGLNPTRDTIAAFYDRIIDARYEGAQEGRLRTMLTSNLLVVAPRMASRLGDKRLARTVVIDAPDYRMNPHGEKL